MTPLKSFVLLAMAAVSQPPTDAIARGVDEEAIVIGTSYTIDSMALGESRQIFVSVPKDQSRPYPVLYVLNADTAFLPTVATVRHLAVSANKIPNFIVVGVVPINGARETRPSTPGDGSKNQHEKLFRKFVAQELVAHIDATYDTRPYRILAGHSLSGLFTLNTLRSEVDSFSTYFAFSPALWWDNGEEANALHQSMLTRNMASKTVAITIANEGGASQTIHRDFVAGLQDTKSADFTLMQAEFPRESHRSTTLPAMNWALQQLFRGWRPAADVYQLGLTGLKTHYGELSARFGWKMKIPLDDLSSLAFEFARRGDPDDDLRVYELVTYAMEREPSMYEEFVEMTGALKIQGHKEGAATVEKALCSYDSSLSICQN